MADKGYQSEYVEENTNPIPWNQYFTDGTGAIYRILEIGENHMKKTYDLTNTELQIMELLWQAEQPMTFREIMAVHCIRLKNMLKE